MTGEEHFEAAERDIERANLTNVYAEAQFRLQRAQVHATLAAASAFATAAGLAKAGEQS